VKFIDALHELNRESTVESITSKLGTIYKTEAGDFLWLEDNKTVILMAELSVVEWEVNKKSLLPVDTEVVLRCKIAQVDTDDAFYPYRLSFMHGESCEDDVWVSQDAVEVVE
jgi:hypothetical protein